MSTTPDRSSDFLQARSPFAARLARQYPDSTNSIPQPPNDDLPTAALNAALRDYRNRHLLQIVRDELNDAPLESVLGRLSSLAEQCLQAALSHHENRLAEKHGPPRNDAGDRQRLTVLAMGKLGGRELNLSSDIDIVFCYPQSGETDGPRRVSNEQFFTRVARGVIASLNDVTEKGFVFRVDTRLRPYGSAGPLVQSFAALEEYYQREGRDWERYALIKARPVAGDAASGERLLETIKPFVYRRYVDYSAIESLAVMQRDIRTAARRVGGLGDIKRGPGGIREAEFFVQSFQLLRGGRLPTLQTPSFFAAAKVIHEQQLADAETVAQIERGYRYLRRLENRIQALHDRQTHRMPTGDEDRDCLIQAMNTKSWSDLTEVLNRHRNAISSAFNGLLAARPDKTRPSPAQDLWFAAKSVSNNENDQPIAKEAKELTDLLRQFAGKIPKLKASDRARERLERFMPELIQAYQRQDVSLETLASALRLTQAVLRRSAYLALLAEHPAALDRMLRLFSRSPWLTGQVTRYPVLLDEFIDPRLSHSPAEALPQAFAAFDAGNDAETRLVALNDAKRGMQLRIAIAELEGHISTDEAQQLLSRLAELSIERVLALSRDAIAARYGELPGLRFGIVAYGSLGAAELGYESDLDLVFLFDGAGDASDGPKNLSGAQYVTRLSQRILHFLTSMTPGGRLYEVDTRLRPNGQSGQLVSSLSAFADYQQSAAWTWELQALSRARFICGHPDIGTEFADIRRQTLCRQRDQARIRSDVLSMRERMTGQLKPADTLKGRLKHGRGGLLDIEFTVQYLLLAGCARHPELAQPHRLDEQLQALIRYRASNTDQLDTLRRAIATLSAERHLAMLTATAEDRISDQAAACMREVGAVWSAIFGQVRSR